MQGEAPDFPRIDSVGTEGLVVRFGPVLSEAANRAALAYRAAFDRDAPSGVEETSTALVSAFLRVDPRADRAAILARAEDLLAERDWTAADLPEGRRLFTIPAVFGTEAAPHLGAAAADAGMDEAAAVDALTSARLRALAIGFAPGQPYLGTLPEAWDIPRQRDLAQVPEGAVVQAVRQLVLFSRPNPTGWRHVGQTALRLFRPEAERPFLLSPGDEVQFRAVGPEEVENMRADPEGGATWEAIP